MSALVRSIALAALASSAMVATLLLPTTTVQADPPETAPSEPAPPEPPPAASATPTIQQRFSRKVSTLSLHLVGTATFRGDFYDQAGGGGAIAYYVTEELGIELRALGYGSWLNATAEQIREETGFVPDTRARTASVLIGARVSVGYGKLQIADAFILHFDPQLIVSGGVSFAEDDRLLPTFLGGLGLLMHFEHGIQAAIDLLVHVDVEERDRRGFVASVGFAPMISIGWHFALGGGES